MRSLATFRAVALSLSAGGAAGAIIGLFARGAMRLAGWMSGRPGAVTAERAVVGDITWTGSVEVVMIGVFVGLAGGAVHAVAHGAMPPRARGAWFGALVLALFGWTILDPANPDFRRFGWSPLNYALFAALFLVFGLLLDRMFRWLDARAPRGAWALLLYAPIVAIGGAVALLNAVFGTDRSPLLGLAAMAALALFVAARRIVAARRPLIA